ncbi:MAG: hypothetical protein CMN31_20230 [Sandaracinus sp.]|nr:hypothetical protein [Myxococcales bacterium]MAT29861.1 hypothetical protein [Sandaracinus sp.]MBJ73619.1 hypothetical protein [Sandaracinus sp.]
MASVRVAVCALLLAALSPLAARAQCAEVEAPATGVTVERCEASERRWWRVRADLGAGDLGLRVSRPSESARSVESWAAAVPGAVVAVQGGDFRFPSYQPEGLTVGAGEAWAQTEDDGGLAVLAFDARGVGVYVPPRQVVPAEAWMENVVSGVEVLRAGAPVDACVGRGCERTSRTGVGLDESGRILVAVVAEGDRPASPGVTDAELGALLRDAGARDAVRTGEGATSLLWAGGAVASASSDGAARPSAAFVGVVDRASGQTTRLRGIVGVEGDEDGRLVGAELQLEALDGRVVTMGGTLTDQAYWEFTVPVREYVVRASHPGYRTGCKVCVGVPSEDVWCSLFLAPGEGEQRCEPPPRVLEVGPWPEAMDAGAPEADAGVGPGGSGVGSGCAAGGAGGAGGRGALAVLLLGALARPWRRR